MKGGGLSIVIDGGGSSDWLREFVSRGDGSRYLLRRRAGLIPIYGGTQNKGDVGKSRSGNLLLEKSCLTR